MFQAHLSKLRLLHVNFIVDVCFLLTSLILKLVKEKKNIFPRGYVAQPQKPNKHNLICKSSQHYRRNNNLLVYGLISELANFPE